VSEPVDWQADGTPRSARFQDVYSSCAGGAEQARGVFLAGCGLPAAWAGLAQWRILETGFGLGLNFLATWHAWRSDPQRPRMLHFASVEAYPVGPDDLLRAAAVNPELLPLARQLAAQWWGLLPGVHRMAFEDGCVLLTLCVGDVKAALREQQFEADAVFLDGFSPPANPQMWDAYTLKAVARLCRRGTRLATWTIARPVRDTLAQCGFVVRKAPGLPPKRDSLQGIFDPHWEPRKRMTGSSTGATPPMHAARCIVIGAGLAGAAAAASLARRGWRVQVLDVANAPASGASGLPAGLAAPHVSPDDSLLSRLSRAGVRITLQQVRGLLHEGEDWMHSGVLEHHVDGRASLSAAWPLAGRDWSEVADEPRLAQAALPPDATATWHHQAGWIKPARLVAQLLAQPGISWQGQADVHRLAQAEDGSWQVLDVQGRALAFAELVVVAAGPATRALLGTLDAAPLPLQAIRGQVSWALHAGPAALPDFPVNGDGSLLPAVPTAAGAAWYLGASFLRDDEGNEARQADHEANFSRLQTLLPAAARALAPAFTLPGATPELAPRGAVQAWVGVRCAARDRLPLVGPLDHARFPGLQLSTAMGSRGLTFALLGAELLAAQLHGEPLPVDAKLARALRASRYSLASKTEDTPQADAGHH
jgi:tRNA 5-methylaminomethyl-2-thiouridine biosynthesis bifunctional protein